MTDSAISFPERLGLPAADQLKRLRIWDAYFTPSHSHPGKDGSENLIADIERSMPAIQLGCIERLCYFAHVGIGTTGDREVEARLREDPRIIQEPLERFPQLLLGMIQVNGNDPERSLDAINRWVADGPMLGAYFPGGGPGAVTCTDPNVDVLVRRLVDLKGVIMHHTWFKTGGKQGTGESTPSELAELARRFPEQPFLCAHAGGEWERGLRAIRSQPNIFVETSGFDSTAGFLEMAVRDVGAERIVFGSHLPSRSLGTELAKVLGAEITDQDRQRILGENVRQLIRVAQAAKR